MEELRRLAGVKVPDQGSETADATATKVSASKASVAKPQTAPPPRPLEAPVGFLDVHKAVSKEPSAKVAASPIFLAATQGESTKVWP